MKKFIKILFPANPKVRDENLIRKGGIVYALNARCQAFYGVAQKAMREDDQRSHMQDISA